MQQKLDEAESARAERDETISGLKQTIENLEADKNEFANSLDLTKIEMQKETSRYEDEIRLLTDSSNETVSRLETSFKSMLLKYNLVQEGVDDFNDMISKCSEILGNHMEEKRNIQKMVEAKEDAARALEDLKFQLEKVTA